MFLFILQITCDSEMGCPESGCRQEIRSVEMFMAGF